MAQRVKVAHLTTVDMSLRYLLLPQLLAVIERGGDVVGISAPGPWVEELERRGIRHRALASSTRSFAPFADLRAAFELWSVLRDERPDVLHTHNPKPGIYGRIVGRMARVPVVVNTVHGLFATPDDPILKRAVVYFLEAVASRFSDAELVQNPEDLAVLRRLRIAPKAALLGNGIDLARFDPSKVPERLRVEIREELDIADEQVVVGTTGRLVREKGYPELFVAAQDLADDGYVVVCLGADDPAKPDALDRATIEAARAHGVRFLGHRDDVEAVLSAFDVFVLASHREGFPRAAMEAAAMGLPIVATDIRGCREVVEPGVNGVLVPARDANAIAAGVRSVSDPRVRAQFGRASRERAARHFDERVVVDRVLKAYRAAAARKGRSLDLGEAGGAAGLTDAPRA